MYKSLFLYLLTFLVSTTTLLAISQINLDEQLVRDDFEVKRFFLLKMTTKDLDSYDKIVSVITAGKIVGQEPTQELTELKEDFEKFFIRRIAFSAKTYLPHKKELEANMQFLEAKQPFELVPFETVLAAYTIELAKGDKRCAGFLQRAQLLLNKARSLEAVNQFKDELVMHIPHITSEEIFQAKVTILNKWIVKGQFSTRAKQEIDRLHKDFNDHPLYLGLNANYHTQMGRRASGPAEKKEYLDNAFDFYIEAVNKGLKDANACPGLFSEYMKIRTKQWNALAQDFRYPQHVVGFEVRAVNLRDDLVKVLKFIPEKEFRKVSYRILRDMFTYWPNSIENIQTYNDLMTWERLAR